MKTSSRLAAAPRLASLAIAVLFGSAILSAGAAPATALDPGLVAQWPLDTVSGSGASATTPDASGAGQTGTFQASPTLQAGRFGTALDLASNHQRLQVAKPLSGGWPLEPAQQVSVTAWIKNTSFPGTLKYILDKGNFGSLPSCNGGTYALYTGYGVGVNRGLSFYVWTTNGTSPQSPIVPSSSPIWTDGQWHAVTGTYDGAAVRLYVDGVQVGSGTPHTGALLYTGAIADAFTVGRYADPACPDNTLFPGGIDEVRVHDRALTQAQITKLHDASATSPPDLAEPTDGSTPTAQPTTPPPAAPAQATLTAPTAPVAVGKPAILDASGTKNASRLLWDVNGDGTQDFQTAASQPYLSIRPVRGGATNVSVTAVGLNGSTSTSASRLVFAGSSGSSPAASTIKPMLITAASATPGRLVGTTSVASQLRNDAAFARTVCLQGTTVTFGLVEAFGCFARTSDLAEVPDPVRDIVRRHYDSERYPYVAQIICNLAARGERTQAQCDAAKAFFANRNLDVYVAQSIVRMNGMTITPGPGGYVVLYPKQQRLIANNATLKWGSFTIASGVIDMNLERGTTTTTGQKIIYTDSPAGTPGPNGLVPPRGRASLLFFDAAKSVPSIGGFKLNGTAELALTALNGVRSAAASVHVELPGAFNLFGGAPPTGDVTLASSNADPGPELDNLDLQVPQANLGGAYFRDVRFRYARNGRIDNDTNEGTACFSRQWKAQAKLYIGGQPNDPNATAILMAPQPSQNGIGFCDGGFKHAGFRLELGKTVRPQVFPGVFLSQLNFAMQLDPTIIRGGAGLTVGDVTQVDGALLVAFATPRQPYRLSTGDAGQEFAALEGRLFDTTTIAVGGAVKVNVPRLGQLGLGNGAVMYSYPDFVAFGGSMRVVLPGMSVEGGLNGWVEIGNKRFQLAGGGQACIAGLPVSCIGAQVMIGSRGASACGNIGGKRRPDGTFAGGLNPGAGLRWDELWPTVWVFDGCKPSRFWEVARPRARARAAQDAAPGEAQTIATVLVRAGEAAKNLQITGVGGAPQVRIVAPDGTVLQSKVPAVENAAQEAARAKATPTEALSQAALKAGEGRMAIVRQPEGNVTWAGIAEAKAGSYRIETLPGSVPIASVQETRDGYDTNFTAQVAQLSRLASEIQGRAGLRARAAATAGTRVLRYDARKVGGGQLVTFVERGSDVNQILGTSRGGKGTLRFTPAPGRDRSREIVAVTTIDGTPIPDQVLARYTVAPPRAITPPSAVRVRRQGKGAVVRWTAVPGAAKYSVTVRAQNGTSQSIQVGARARSLRLPTVSRTYATVVAVTAADAEGTWSQARTARLRRTTAPRTALQSAQRNQRKTVRGTRP